MSSATNSTHTVQRSAPYSDGLTYAVMFARITRWETRHTNGKCPRCGKTIGKKDGDRWTKNSIHCGKCAKIWAVPFGRHLGRY